MNGKGIWKIIDNKTNMILEMYEGTFVSNQKHGYGIHRKGIDTYKGSFTNNKMNGNGTFLRENKFVIEHGEFHDNVIQGKVIINWSKLAFFTGYMINGRIQKDGYYYTFDKSYDYEGPWVNGLPVYDNMSNYIHCDIDRSMIADEPVAPVDPKAKGKVDPKAATSNDIIVKQGKALGKITVLSGHGLTQEEIQAAIEAAANAPVDPKAKGKPDFVPPSNPRPALHAVPYEKIRKVLISLNDIHGERYSLWTKRHGAIKMIYSPLRFSPATILYIDGTCYTKKPRILPDGRQVSVEYKLEGDASLIEKNESRSLQDLNGILTPLGSSSSITFKGEELPGSSELLTFLTDFKLDHNQIIESIQNDDIQSNEEYHQVRVMTLSRSLDDVEIKNSNLELTLLIPRNGIRLVEQTEGIDGNDTTVVEEKADQDNPSKVMDCVVTNCIWELRLIKQVEAIPDIVKQSSDFVDENPDSNVNDEAVDIPIKDSEFLAETVDALNEVQGPVPQPIEILSETIVCARWFDSKFIASNWHSVALTIRNADNIVDIAIDGTGKMRSISNEIISDDEGLALAWLPEKVEEPKQKDDENTETVASEEQATVPTNIKMIYRIGSDSFCGIVKTLSISTHLDREDIWEMTKCYSTAIEEDRSYAKEVAYRKLMKEKAERGELEPIGNLIVKLVSCSDLVCADNAKGSGSSDPFVVLTVAKASFESKRLQNALNPVYNETFEIPWDGINPLFLKVWDDDVSKSDDTLGDLTIPVGDFDFSTKKVLKIEEKPLQHVSKGKISVDVTFKRKWVPIGMLSINLISCIDLMNMDFAEGSGVSDPYVSFTCGPNTIQSRHIMNSLNPEFNEWLHIEWDGWEPLRIQVFDEDFGKVDDFEGSTEVVLSGFDFSNNNVMFVRNKNLSGSNPSNNPKFNDQSGKINLDIKFNQTKWLNHFSSIKNTTPDGFVRYNEIPLSLICGTADIDDVFIPDDIPVGDYFIEISDGVTKECIYSTENTHAIKTKTVTSTDEEPTTINVNDLDNLKPSDVVNMHMIVEPIQSFKVPIKVVEPNQA